MSNKSGRNIGELDVLCCGGGVFFGRPPSSHSLPHLLSAVHFEGDRLPQHEGIPLLLLRGACCRTRFGYASGCIPCRGGAHNRKALSPNRKFRLFSPVLPCLAPVYPPIRYISVLAMVKHGRWSGITSIGARNGLLFDLNLFWNATHKHTLKRNF